MSFYSRPGAPAASSSLKPFVYGAISAATVIAIAGVFFAWANRKEYVDKATGAPDIRPGPPKDLNNYQWMFVNANTGRSLLRIHLKDIPSSKIPVSSELGHQVVGSYTWVQTDMPTIYAPGTIPQYTPPEYPWKLDSDTGYRYVDQHAHRAPVQPYEPLLQAIAVVNPKFSVKDIDIVANRSSIEVLLDFMRGKSTQAFTLDLDLVGKTMFIGKKIKNAKSASKDLTYGRNFEPAFTTEDPEFEDAQGHYRMISYDLGELKTIIRFEVDAYLPLSEELGHSAAQPSRLPDHVADSDTANGITHGGPHQTTVIPKGTLISQERLIEMKSNNKGDRPKEQMWLGRTPIAVLARHKDGTYYENNVQTKFMYQKDLEEFENNANIQAGLRKVVGFLKKLREVVDKTDEKAAVLTSMGKGQAIEIWGVKKKIGALPDEIVERLWGAGEAAEAE